MCRLFGFRSEKPVKPFNCLLKTKNSFLSQSKKNNDGWGISYFTNEKVAIIKNTNSAHNDKSFFDTSTNISSNTILAHIRKATQGSLDINNTQPFKYNDWVFAHNGNLKNFKAIRKHLISKINKELRKNIIGKTDSEVIFYLIISKITDVTKVTMKNLIDAVRSTIDEIEAFTGKIHQNEVGASSETYISFIITNGSLMLAHQGGKNIYYSQHNFSDETTCLCSFKDESFEVSKHIIFSSEPLDNNTWIKMNSYEIAVVDYDFNIHFFRA